MSWRVIFAILIIAAGASAWGGIRLGDWLVAHGPVAPPAPEFPELSDVPVLNADGRPYVAQPPQPLTNGQLGVPAPPEQYAWQVPPASLEKTIASTNIALATTMISMDEARMIAENGGSQPLQGIADVSGLGLGSDGMPGQQALQPIEVAPPPPPPPPVVSPSNQSWQASLRQDLQACSALGFFDRPSCAWNARNKYCQPNNAWGRVADCPSKSF